MFDPYAMSAAHKHTKEMYNLDNIFMMKKQYNIVLCLYVLTYVNDYDMSLIRITHVRRR